MADKNNLRNFNSALDRVEFLEKELNISLKNISNFGFSEEQVSGRNIENLIGAVQIPVGVAGPVKIRSSKSEIRNCYVPLATTEGALVASVSRGCKVISQSGGALVLVENVGITRGPVFKTLGILHSQKIKGWIMENFDSLKKASEETSSHLELLKADFSSAGKNLFVRFYFDTQDAMGMNMATIATGEIVKIIEKETKAKCVSVAGNYDIDKKSAWLNFISGRGKRVWAEVVVSKKDCKEILKVTPEEICDVVTRKIYLGSAMAGSLGFNAHFANVVAAIFAATGQDLGHIVEGSLGVTSAEVLENGDLYFSIYMPSLVLGTVGGGTNLPTQKEALEILGLEVGSNVLKFAEIVAAAVLSGELSLISSQTQGSLAAAHVRHGRNNQVSKSQSTIK